VAPTTSPVAVASPPPPPAKPRFSSPADEAQYLEQEALKDRIAQFDRTAKTLDPSALVALVAGGLGPPLKRDQTSPGRQALLNRLRTYAHETAVVEFFARHGTNLAMPLAERRVAVETLLAVRAKPEARRALQDIARMELDPTLRSQAEAGVR
jgi:hypothetical protein